MTDDHGPTVKALRHEKGRLKMVSREDTAPTPASAINDPPEMIEKVAEAMFMGNWRKGLARWEQAQDDDRKMFIEWAYFGIAAVRQWDREQRAKIEDWRVAFAEMTRRELSEMGVDWMVHGYAIARFETDGIMSRIDPKDIVIRPTVDRTAPEPSREPSNPDDYTDPFNMVTRSESGGLTEFKRS